MRLLIVIVRGIGTGELIAHPVRNQHGNRAQYACNSECTPLHKVPVGCQLGSLMLTQRREKSRWRGRKALRRP